MLRGIIIICFLAILKSFFVVFDTAAKVVVRKTFDFSDLTVFFYAAHLLVEDFTAVCEVNLVDLIIL